MSKQLELAKKLKELADRGVGGEKLNAQEILLRFLKKHNISLEDIEEEKITEHYFLTKTATETRILAQVIWSVNYKLKCYDIPAKLKKQYALKGNVMIDCTYSEFIEIQSKFDFYLPIFYREFEIFVGAFCHANNLISNRPDKKNYDELTPEERERYARQQVMSVGIKSEKHHKKLENGQL